MIFKNPRSIADLNINWTFIEDDGLENSETGKTAQLFEKLNPKIHNLIIITDNYIFHFEDEFITINSYHESLKSFISYMNYEMWTGFQREIVLDHFERISENEFRIIEKKL